jgi:CDP-diacylglycerol--glycerol-3-phosphate 3-phosphatidyltransferase
MNWANRLTLGRLALTILFVLALSSTWVYGRTIALVLFLLAGISDYFDGEIARRYGIVTKFGKLMDPLVDKVMMAAAFICLVPLGAVPAWVATIVVARDFLITGLRLLASSEGNVLPAEKLGKHKTSWQITTVLFFLLLLSASELRPTVEEAAWWRNSWRYGGDALLWITIGLTIYSGLGYLWRHRALILPTGARA